MTRLSLFAVAQKAGVWGEESGRPGRGWRAAPLLSAETGICEMPAEDTSQAAWRLALPTAPASAQLGSFPGRNQGGGPEESPV